MPEKQTDVDIVFVVVKRDVILVVHPKNILKMIKNFIHGSVEQNLATAIYEAWHNIKLVKGD